MARFNEKKIPYNKQVGLLNMFCDTISKLKSKEEIYNFLKDLLNRQERLMLIRRLLIAELLIAGESYTSISRELKCGRSTIARIQKWVNFGRGGYQVAVRKRKLK